MTDTPRRMVILAGPNGAGKTTLAKYLLPLGSDILQFVNADQIASGLSAFSPESVAFEAGRVMLRRIDVLMREGTSFAFETTLSSKSIAGRISKARLLGYKIELIYVALPSVQLAKRRVLARVRKGGHAIPQDVIERRFYRSLWNLQQIYAHQVDRWWVFENAQLTTPQLVARGGGGRTDIFLEDTWNKLSKLAQKH